MHSGDHDRARDAGVTSGGRAEIRPDPGADQPGSRTGHERLAKEQELIMPNDVRLTTAAALRRSPSFRLSNSSAEVDPLGPPRVRAVCGRAARTDLRGRRDVTRVSILEPAFAAVHEFAVGTSPTMCPP